MAELFQWNVVIESLSLLFKVIGLWNVPTKMKALWVRCPLSNRLCCDNSFVSLSYCSFLGSLWSCERIQRLLVCMSTAVHRYIASTNICRSASSVSKFH